jgi:hypothetical protein
VGLCSISNAAAYSEYTRAGHYGIGVYLSCLPRLLLSSTWFQRLVIPLLVPQTLCYFDTGIKLKKTSLKFKCPSAHFEKIKKIGFYPTTSTDDPLTKKIKLVCQVID